MSDTWAERFNTVHVPAGSATGGQFGTSSGGSSGGSSAAKGGAKAPARPAAKAAPAHKMSPAHAAEKARLLAQARKDAHEAAVLEKQLAGLEKQAATAAAASKKSAAAAKASLKAGHVVHHRKHAAHHAAHHKHHQSLKQKITSLKGRIRTLREQAAGLEKQANAIRSGGQVTNPGGTERLHEYWVHGPGAEKIRWGEPNDFDRCVEHLGKFIKDPKGYCNLAHKAATGMYPAQHAAMEKKATGRSAVTTMTERADAKNKPYGNVTYADPKNGKYPLDTEAHCRAAWSYINMPKNAAMYPLNGVTLSEVKDRIKAALKKYGADVSSDSSSASRTDLFRSYPLEDYHIVRVGEGDSTGRVVEAYMTVFGEETEIHDHQGHYKEDIDRAAFNKRIADLERSRNGFRAAKVFYNHGMTIHGTPSDRYSMPTAVCEGIRVDTRGPITRSRYLDTPLGNEVLEMWRSGAVTAQSFTGAIIRSSPELSRGEKYRPRNGQLPRVKRLELGLKEYGPTPFPAYQGAELVGVRMSPLGTWQAADDDEEHEEHDEQALPPDEEAATGEPLTRTDGDDDEHSARYHQHALYRMTSEEARKKAGLVW